MELRQILLFLLMLGGIILAAFLHTDFLKTEHNQTSMTTTTTLTTTTTTTIPKYQTILENISSYTWTMHEVGKERFKKKIFTYKTILNYGI
jgi:hypothetical protein